ncbi:MAG: response regulator transcription factor [Peptococcaceae bacterium]
MSGENILIVDDDQDIQEIVASYLKKEGYHTYLAGDGHSALNKVKETPVDLILLDILLPDIDGYEVCQEIKKYSRAPVIFFSCKDEDTDEILGLHLGADDYITKPFSIGVLGAKIKAHLRRKKFYENTDHVKDMIKYENLEIDLSGCQVKVNNKPINLSALEFKILAFLAQNPDRVISKKELFAKIWGAVVCEDTRTVLVHISNLRKKIEEDAANPRYIHNIWGLGYKFTLKK